MAMETIHTNNKDRKTIIIIMATIMVRIMAKEIITINTTVITIMATTTMVITMIIRTTITKEINGADHPCGDNDEAVCPTK